ncbi:MAG: hypothetical protein ACW98D_13180 [Promethearchaeota archaeon]|jgi:hypothetical protein
MSGINQVRNAIKDELERVNPSPPKIISFLFDLRIDQEGTEFSPKDEWRYVPQAEFFSIIEELFSRNPEFYMKYLFMDIKKKMRKISGVDKLREMEINIIEKYCLYPGEQILLTFDGVIQFWENVTLKSRGVVSGGTVCLTSHRIILCPGFSLLGKGLTAMGGSISTGLSSRRRIINYSLQEKCYGYIFPIEKISRLRRWSRGVNYNVTGFWGKNSSSTRHINIIVARAKGPKAKAVRVLEQKENIATLYEILSGQNRCLQCGNINLPKDNFCKRCGSKL